MIRILTFLATNRKINNNNPIYNNSIAVIGIRGFPRVPDGLSVHCEILYPGLYRKGFKPIIYYRFPYIPMKDNFIYKGNLFFYQWAPSSRLWETYVHSAISLVRACKVTKLIHFHGIAPALFIPIAKLLGKKVVFTHHGSDYLRPNINKKIKPLLYLSEKYSLKYADAIICVSRITFSRLRKIYKHKCYYIPNAAQISEPKIDHSFIERLGIQKGNYILFLGRYVPDKGLIDLIKAYRDLDHPPFKLLIAGTNYFPTNYSIKCIELANTIAGIIEIGPIFETKKAWILNNAALLVVPSYFEENPIVVAEAMKANTPVLLSDIPALKFYESPITTFFPKGDIQKLSNAISDSYYKNHLNNRSLSLRQNFRKLISSKKMIKLTYRVLNKIKNEPVV